MPKQGGCRDCSTSNPADDGTTLQAPLPLHASDMFSAAAHGKRRQQQTNFSLACTAPKLDRVKRPGRVSELLGMTCSDGILHLDDGMSCDTIFAHINSVPSDANPSECIPPQGSGAHSSRVIFGMPRISSPLAPIEVSSQPNNRDAYLDEELRNSRRSRRRSYNQLIGRLGAWH
jgi:hypothetical protein